MGPKNLESGMTNSEATKDVLTPEQEAQADYWMAQIEKEMASAAEKSPEQIEKEKVRTELKEIFAVWLVPEKLEPLHALTTQAEALADPLRKEAKLALGEMLKRIHALGDPVDLMEQYKILSRAVGMINSGLVDHTR